MGYIQRVRCILIKIPQWALLGQKMWTYMSSWTSLLFSELGSHSNIYAYNCSWYLTFTRKCGRIASFLAKFYALIAQNCCNKGISSHRHCCSASLHLGGVTWLRTSQWNVDGREVYPFLPWPIKSLEHCPCSYVSSANSVPLWEPCIKHSRDSTTQLPESLGGAECPLPLPIYWTLQKPEIHIHSFKPMEFGVLLQDLVLP